MTETVKQQLVLEFMTLVYFAIMAVFIKLSV